MTTSDDYTFDKMVANLQGLADQMTEQATITQPSTRVIASALDATIENLLWLIRGASISWPASGSEAVSADDPYCHGISPEGFFCTLARDHEGDHEAHGMDPEDKLLRSWPREAVRP